MERGGKSPCITVLQGKQTTVLEMEHPVVDFVTICESPWESGKYKNGHWAPKAAYVLDLIPESLLESISQCCNGPNKS